MKVQDLMTTEVRCCGDGDRLNVAARIMWEADCGAVPVVDEQSQVVGMVTDRDLAMASYTQGKALHDIPVTVAMTRDVLSVGPKDDLRAAEELMQRHAVRRLPVIEDDGHLVGILSLADLAREMGRHKDRPSRELRAGEVADTLAAISRPRN